MITLDNDAKFSILIVEDNLDLMATLHFMLERAGFHIKTARTAHEAYVAIAHEDFHLVLLDIMLPDESGFVICRRLREHKAHGDMSIIFLSAKAEELDKVVAFELGADDYITKPFSVKELLLRIHAVLRRKNPSETRQSKFVCGALTVDFSLPRVWINDHEIVLTILELRLLELLLLRRGKVQSRAQLLTSVWRIEADISTRTVDTHIKRLREKLSIAGSYIRTVRGLGYRFISDDEIREI